jgi:hypothetical protein
VDIINLLVGLTLLFVPLLFVGSVIGAVFSSDVRNAIRNQKQLYAAWLIASIALLSIPFQIRVGQPMQAERIAQTQNRLAQVHTAVLSYETEYGVSPPGSDNASLIKALEGDNPRKIEFINLKPTDTDSAGEIIDSWGTPLQIIMTNPNHPVVKSAGPDKIWNTKDDLSNSPVNP